MAVKESLTVVDNRTGQSHEIPITNNAVRATDFKRISIDNAAKPFQSGLKILDPGYQNTAVAESSITYIDGIKGTIQYRSHSLDQLVELHDFEDVSFLLIWGHLPSPDEKANYRRSLAAHMQPPQSVIDTISGFPRNTPYHLLLTAGLSAWAATNPSAIPLYAGKELFLGKLDVVDKAICETIAASVSIIALVYCHYAYVPFHPLDAAMAASTPMAENMLCMMGRVDPATNRPDAGIVRILNKLWIVYADHEMTNSTAASMHVGSGLADPFSCVSAAALSLSGPLHGGAIDLAYKMFARIGSRDNVPAALDEVKAGKYRLFGYGHRIYKTVDPRVKHLKAALKELWATAESDPHVSVAMEIERLAAQDDYFRARNLNVNADLYGCFVFSAMGFQPEIITALMLAARINGILAHWREQMKH
ncbi:hypothetical protein SCUCBS95973_002831 [Sporothrix curviconia]|uniref:Citrate synthase n=1 Tax=Sporothrix curviconia TaxID=1260050 RepID=A0ABP0BAM5_9PEZI